MIEHTEKLLSSNSEIKQWVEHFNNITLAQSCEATIFTGKVQLNLCLKVQIESGRSADVASVTKLHRGRNRE